MNVYDFFDSIGLIIDSKIEKLNLDSTIICTIKDVTKRSEGVYTVSYGTSNFQVNSADFTLEIGDSVYVGIPQGDYTNAYIISKRIEEVNKVSEGSPFEGFVKELEIEGSISNISNDKIEVKWGNEEEQLIDYPFVNINNFTKLGISLTTNLKESNITDSFGIKLYFTSSRLVNGQEMYFMQTIDLDIGKKLGGIYIANTDIEIKQLFDISDIDNIIQFSAEVYNKSDSNIEYKNLKLYFGGMTADYTKEGLVLYTDKGVQYNTSEIKNIYLRWVYKENEEYKIITSLTPQEDIPKNVKINWYYNNFTDKYAENVWFIQTKPLNIYKDLESYEAQIEYNTIEAESPISIKAKINFESINDNKNIFLKSDEIKLTGYKTEFDDLYHPDGTIVDFALVKDPNKYQVFLNNSPFAKGVYDIDISFEMLYKIPRSKTGLGIGKIPKDFQELEMTDEAFYYYKKILPQTETQNGVQKYAPAITEDLNFNYSVNDFYMPSYNNNTIICEIVALYKGEEVERFSRSLDIKFHRSGICKTDFVLYPKLTDETGEPTRSIRYYQGILNVNVELCDATGNLLEITQDVEWSWYGREGEDTELQIKKINKNQCQITPKDSLRLIDIQNKNYAYVLHASYKTKKANQVNTRVECLIPIGINTSAQIIKDETTGNLEEGIYNFQYIGGPTIINYNSNGGEPSFYSTNYRLLTSDLEEHPDMSWICKIPVSQHAEEKTYYPHLENREGKYYLVAPSLYTKGTEIGAVIFASSGNTIQWIQPLVSYQSTSFSSFINDWDGKLLIDENEGTAMTARLGAGVKDENGKFSGVLLGEWQTKIEDGSWTSKTGLYGYDKSEQSYGFREDGTAFIGKSGAGRINFNGDQGLIYSSNFDGEINLSLNQARLDKTVLNRIGLIGSGFPGSWDKSKIKASDNLLELEGNISEKASCGRVTYKVYDDFKAGDIYKYRFKIRVSYVSGNASIEDAKSFYFVTSASSEAESHDQDTLGKQVSNYYYINKNNKMEISTSKPSSYNSFWNNDNEMEDYITIEGSYQIKENVNIGEYIHFDLTPIVPKKKSPQSVTYKISIKDLEIYKNVVNLPENYCSSNVKKINEFNEDLENFIPEYNSLGLLSSGTVGTYLDLKNGEFICDKGLLREGVEIRGKITGRKISSYSSMFIDETSASRNLYSTLEYLPYEENLYHVKDNTQTKTDYFYMSLWEKMTKCMSDDKNGYRERVMPALSFSVNKSSFDEWGISLGGTELKQQWATENVGIRALFGNSDTFIESSVINIRPKQLNIKSWGNAISLIGGGDDTTESIKIKSNNTSFIAKDNKISLEIENGTNSEISLINTQGKTLVPTSLNIKNMEVGLNFEQVEEGIGDGDVANSRIKVSFTYQELDGEGNPIKKTMNYYITRKFFQYLIDDEFPGIYNN